MPIKMTSLSLNRFNRSPQPFSAQLRFSAGLHGYEEYKDFFLCSDEEKHPYLWLMASEVTFLVVDPLLICSSYRPTLLQRDLDYLRVGPGAQQLFLLAIVQRRKEGDTLNLAAPLLIDWGRKTGRQILVPNQPVEYSIACPTHC